MNELLTGKNERILSLFLKLDCMAEKLGILSRTHCPVLGGEHYFTDSEFSGRLKICCRTLQEYRMKAGCPISGLAARSCTGRHREGSTGRIQKVCTSAVRGSEKMKEFVR